MENEAPSLDPMAATAIRTMKDIVLPAPVSWFPQTWGWAAVGIVLLAAVFAWGAFAVVHFRRNAYRRRALKVLDQIVQSSKSDPSGGEYAAELAVLMKRVALAAWGRERVAHLSGRDWADFIAMHADGNPQALRGLVDDMEYRRPASGGGQGNADDMVSEARKWIERHHV